MQSQPERNENSGSDHNMVPFPKVLKEGSARAVQVFPGISLRDGIDEFGSDIIFEEFTSAGAGQPAVQ